LFRQWNNHEEVDERRAEAVDISDDLAAVPMRKGAEAVDISDDLAAAPAVVRRSTVNSDKSAPASKLCLSPIRAHAEVTDNNTAADGLMKRSEE
jgi:hypothetical protein